MVWQDVGAVVSLLQMLKRPLRWARSILFGAKCASEDRQDLSRSVRLLYAHVDKYDLAADKPRLTLVLEVQNFSVFNVKFRRESGRLRFGSHDLSGAVEVSSEPCPRSEVANISITSWIDSCEATRIQDMAQKENHVLLGLGKLDIRVVADGVPHDARLVLPDKLQLTSRTLRADPEKIAGDLRRLPLPSAEE